LINIFVSLVGERWRIKATHASCQNKIHKIPKPRTHCHADALTSPHTASFLFMPTSSQQHRAAPCHSYGLRPSIPWSFDMKISPLKYNFSSKYAINPFRNCSFQWLSTSREERKSKERYINSIFLARNVTLVPCEMRSHDYYHTHRKLHLFFMWVPKYSL
jgi:hypothetical protein